MMRISVPFVAVALLATVLAGCSDAPPSGEFSTDRHAVTVDGTATLEYQAKSRPGGIDNQVTDEICRNAPDTDGCAEPMSTVSAHFMTLPEPSSEGYTAVLTSSDGSEEPLGPLTAGENGMYDLAEQTFQEDLSGVYDTFEIRMGDILVATAPATSGEQTFEANPELLGISATASYEGEDLTVTVSGAPEGLPMRAYLYKENEETGALEPTESFPVSNGENTYTAEDDIDTFAAFHIHVGSSKINVAQGPIQ